MDDLVGVSGNFFGQAPKPSKVDFYCISNFRIFKKYQKFLKEMPRYLVLILKFSKFGRKSRGKFANLVEKGPPFW